MFWLSLGKDRNSLHPIPPQHLLCLTAISAWASRSGTFGSVPGISVISLLLSFVAVLLSTSLKTGRMPCLSSGGKLQQSQGCSPARDVLWVPETWGAHENNITAQISFCACWVFMVVSRMRLDRIAVSGWPWLVWERSGAQLQELSSSLSLQSIFSLASWNQTIMHLWRVLWILHSAQWNVSWEQLAWVLTSGRSELPCKKRHVTPTSCSKGMS